MRRFRRLNRIYAFLMGYYWLPCRICGGNYGGHEGGPVSVDQRVNPDGSVSGWMTCWKHLEEAP